MRSTPTASSGASLKGSSQQVAPAYATLLGDRAVRNELEIKRSRFITVLRRVEDEGSAKQLQADLRKELHDARHHCSAFVIGSQRDLQRSNDDGEPSGTAGVPMLDSLTKFQLPLAGGEATLPVSDVVAVVVRYFGGILLGAGGLVRAYSDSVSQALQVASFVRREQLALYTINASHMIAARLENELRSFGVIMTGNSYQAETTVLGIALPNTVEDFTTVSAQLASWTRGQAQLQPVGNNWIEVPIERRAH